MSSTNAIRLLVHGANGRMGARIVALARDDARFDVIAAIDRDDRAIADALPPDSFDALIDFSSDDGAAHAARLAMAHRAALLVGTTGLSPNSVGIIEEAARSAPVMIAPNTSLGVAVINHLAGEAARLLGPDFEIDLIESHHVNKRDSPSGTALRLVQTLRENAGVQLLPERVQSIRIGDVIGDHTVQFLGPGEIVKIFHSATNRDLFARGALRAAAWLHGRKPGRYTIEQSFGLAKT